MPDIADYTNVNVYDLVTKWDTTEWDNHNVIGYAAIINAMETILDDDWYSRDEDERTVMRVLEMEVGLQCTNAPQVFKAYDLVCKAVDNALAESVRPVRDKWDANPSRPMFDIMDILARATRHIRWMK